MFWKQEIRVPPSFEPVINFKVETARPVYAGRNDQVHFVSFAPAVLPVSKKTKSREGLAFEATATVRIQLPRDATLTTVLRDAGHATRAEPGRVSAEEISKRQKLSASIEAAIDTYAQSEDYFHLCGHDDAALRSTVRETCKRSLVEGVLETIDFAPIEPSHDVLARLTARALIEPSLKDLVDFLQEATRQAIRAKADAAISELRENDRVADQKDEDEKRQAQRQHEANLRNNEILETKARYTFESKKRRMGEEKELAADALQVAQAKTEEAVLKRRERELDLELEIKRERELATVRAGQHERTVAMLGGIVEKLAALRAPDYKGIHTLIMGGAESRDQIAGPLWNVISGLLEKLTGPTAAERKTHDRSSGEA